MRRIGRSLPAMCSTLHRSFLTNDGDDLFDGQWQFLVPDNHTTVPHVTGPRVGLSGPGSDAAVFPWRYWVDETASVSTYRPGRSPSPTTRALRTTKAGSVA
ncbi:MAG: hypothetical protein ABI568_02665 [Pseudarthrobacter sp.]